MSTPPLQPTREEARRAIESLRGGTPSDSAVRVLRHGNEGLRQRFSAALNTVAGKDEPVPGLLLTAGFGAGKSHSLSQLRLAALETNFVVSQVVIGKECPLFDWKRLLTALVESAELRDCVDPVLFEILRRLSENSDWMLELQSACLEVLNPHGGLFAGLIEWLRVARDKQEVQSAIETFITTGDLQIRELKTELRSYNCSTQNIRSLPPSQAVSLRLRFVPLLLTTIGLAGWVILLDECELIFRYSGQQRAKSYASMAQLLNHSPSKVFCVAASTNDPSTVASFQSDKTRLAYRLGQRNAGLLPLAEEGMGLLEGPSIQLERPTQDRLQTIEQDLRRVYAIAYGWVPPIIPALPLMGSRPLRAHVKYWILAWDMERIEQIRPDAESMSVETVEIPTDEVMGLSDEEADDEADDGHVDEDSGWHGLLPKGWR